MKYRLCINGKTFNYCLLTARELLIEINKIEMAKINNDKIYSLFCNLDCEDVENIFLFQATDDSEMNFDALKEFLISKSRKTYGLTKEKAERISLNTEKAYKEKYGELNLSTNKEEGWEGKTTQSIPIK